MGSNTSTYKIPRTTVVTSSATDVWVPATRWFSADKILNGRGWLEMNGRFNAALVKPAYQTCNYEQTPDTPIALSLLTAGGYADADGCHEPASSWVSMPSVAGKKEIRFGWIVKTGGSVGGASVEGFFQVSY